MTRKFYRLHCLCEGGTSAGYKFFTSMLAVEKAASAWRRDNKDMYSSVGTAIEVIYIEPTKDGILKALNRYAGHADNG